MIRRQELFHLTLLLGLTSAVAITGGVVRAQDPASLVRFSAMGDVPYSSGEDRLLAQQITALPVANEFVIHLGDIKSGLSPCNEQAYIKVQQLLSRSRTPVFIIPGDNEWNDCRTGSSTSLGSIKSGSTSCRSSDRLAATKTSRSCTAACCLSG